MVVKRKGLFWWLVAGLGSGLVLAAGGAWYLRATSEPVVVQAIGCADIVRGCKGDGLTVRMDRVPEVLRPFGLEVTADGADGIEASFQMAGMEMGFNRYRLQQRDDQRWYAEVTLPVCARGRKDWLLLLEVRADHERRQIAVPFRTR